MLFIFPLINDHPHVRCSDFDNVHRGGHENEAQAHPAQKSRDGKEMMMIADDDGGCRRTGKLGDVNEQRESQKKENEKRERKKKKKRGEGGEQGKKKMQHLNHDEHD